MRPGADASVAITPNWSAREIGWRIAATVHGSPERHTPTVLFSVAGRAPREVHELLAARSVNAPAGSFYALEAARWMGLGDAGGVRAGLAPYTDDQDVDRLLAGVAEACR